MTTALSGFAWAPVPALVNQSRKAGVSTSDFHSAPAGTLVTASKSASSEAGVMARISAFVALAFWQMQKPLTAPGPAWPPLRMTFVALKAMSQAPDSRAEGVGVTIASSARST
jgi:hypothetical protein